MILEIIMKDEEKNVCCDFMGYKHGNKGFSEDFSIFCLSQRCGTDQLTFDYF